MKRTKQWWASLTKEERSELHYLECTNSSYHSSCIPDDCVECGRCSTPHSGFGLCPMCTERLDRLIEKANAGQG